MSTNRSDMQTAIQGTDAFLRAYFRAYDSPNRATELRKFYRGPSSCTWNGTRLDGLDEIMNFLVKVPPSAHEVQSYDCHIIPGMTPPSLMVAITGVVMHGSDRGQPSATTNKKPDEHPRTFSQSFVLMEDLEADATPHPKAKKPLGPRYYVKTDMMRFVG